MTYETIRFLKAQKNTEPSIEMKIFPASSTWKNKFPFRFIKFLKCHPCWAGSIITVLVLFQIYHKNDVNRFISQVFTSNYNNDTESINSSTVDTNILNTVQKDDDHDPGWLYSQPSTNKNTSSNQMN